MKTFHKNSKHNSSYNFKGLVEVNPSLHQFIVDRYGNKSIDFSNPMAVKELNRSLLMMYYGVNYWEFPDENLCPPIPSRVDYLYYLRDLLINPDNSARVLDIGTGASVIYPLLGALEFGWSFVGVDICNESIKYAKKIIDNNDIHDKVLLRLQPDSSHILEGIIYKDEHFDFTMCNPPFYKTLEEAQDANMLKNRNLGLADNRNFSGKYNELCYKGGEKAFLHSYLYESSLNPKLSDYFTSLVSRKENLKSLETSAKKLGVSLFKVISVKQGNKQTRIVCWSFLK